MSGKVNRRSFLGSLAAVPFMSAFAQTLKPAFAFSRVKLGKTGIETTRLGFGTGVNSNMRSSGLLRKWGRKEAIRLLRGAYDRGIRFFDVADSYGTHQLLAEALKGVPRASYCLSTKYWWMSGGIPKEDHQDVPTSLTRFLRELNTDYLDIVELHCVSSANWQKELAPQMEALDCAKKAGLIRAHGCSFHAYAALDAARDCAWLDCAHVRINHRGRCMSTTPARQMEAIRALHHVGKGIIGMKLLGVGAFDSDNINRSLGFVKASGAVDVFNVGFLSLEEIDDLVKRLDRI